jgi:CBS domain containing-hemolysin-like protein
MQLSAILFGAVVLFLVGLRLSAFFSGSETGFYRASFLRLSIEANSGDHVARRLLWFARNPSYFVATTLVGNNVSNYITTLAIGMFVVALFPANAHWMEIVATLLCSPLIFLCGELLPKNLYYRAPLLFLRRDAARLIFFYRLFLPVSLPLIGITKFIEHIGGASQPRLELVLGRIRLAQILRQGHSAGLLTASQGGLVHGLLHTAAEPVSSSMTPTADIAGMPDNSSTAELLEFAARAGQSHIPLYRHDSSSTWYGYVRVIDLMIEEKPLPDIIRTMRRIDASTSKLQVLRTLRAAENELCVVTTDDKTVGIVGERTLVEELFTPPRGTGILAPEQHEP